MSSTFISNARLKLAKIKQKPSSTQRLNICYSRIICFFHPCHHPNIIGDISKKVQKAGASVLIKFYY